MISSAKTAKGLLLESVAYLVSQPVLRDLSLQRATQNADNLREAVLVLKYGHISQRGPYEYLRKTYSLNDAYKEHNVLLHKLLRVLFVQNFSHGFIISFFLIFSIFIYFSFHF